MLPLALGTAVAFDGSSATEVDLANDAIELGSNHGWQTGDAIYYTSGGGSTPIGLVSDGALIDRGVYFSVVDSLTPTKLQLAASYADATATTPVVLDLAALGWVVRSETNRISLHRWLYGELLKLPTVVIEFNESYRDRRGRKVAPWLVTARTRLIQPRRFDSSGKAVAYFVKLAGMMGPEHQRGEG